LGVPPAAGLVGLLDERLLRSRASSFTGLALTSREVCFFPGVPSLSRGTLFPGVPSTSREVLLPGLAAPAPPVDVRLAVGSPDCRRRWSPDLRGVEGFVGEGGALPDEGRLERLFAGRRGAIESAARAGMRAAVSVNRG
jgi:hypothetical protein